MKNFALTEKVKLQFRTDLFNILNHPNYANPDGGICLAVSPASGTTPAGCLPNANFGVTASTVANQTGNGQIGNGTARQAQFSAKCCSNLERTAASSAWSFVFRYSATSCKRTECKTSRVECAC